MTDVIADLPRFIDASEPWFRTSLRTLVEQATVSPGATDPGPIVAGVEVAAKLMQEAGAQVEVVPSGGTPSLIARFTHPNPKARIVIYNHFDVQPADPANWTQEDPFRFEVREDPEREFLYLGRGTTDDKGPALCALRAAQWLKQHEVPVEVVLLWETEEEIGSPNFADVLRSRKEVLTGDAVIVSDTIWPSAETPAISSGLRGGLVARLSLRTAGKETHSGLTGGVARNPVRELAALVTAIDGAGFWRVGVDPITDAEVEGFMRSGFEPEYFRRSHALERLETEVPVEMMLRLWARPTFEVHGLVGGYAGPGIKSSVPAEAEARVSFRLVPSQHPDGLLEALKRFVADFNPDVVVESYSCFVPYQGPITGPVHEAIVHGMREAFGKQPALVREGGSIGAVPLMEQELGIPVHFLPLSLPEHGYHAPNERFDWKQAKGGIAAYVHALTKLVG